MLQDGIKINILVNWEQISFLSLLILGYKKGTGKGTECMPSNPTEKALGA